MKISKKATSIAEAIIVTLIIVVGLTGIYKIFSVSIKLTNSIENKIQAIQIAREGIEAMTNIRDTNSLLFSSDIDNCWKTLNYDAGCIGGGATNIEETSYKIFKDSDFRWFLEKPIAPLSNYSAPIYRDFYKVGLDSNGLYTQSGGTILKQNFTREIKINYIEAIDGDPLTNTDGIKVSSIVNWKDSSSDNIHEIELETILTNHN